MALSHASRITLLTCCFVGLFTVVCAQAANQPFVPGEVIVKYNEQELDLETRHGRVEAIAFEKANDLERIGEVKDQNIRLLESAGDTREIINTITNNPKVELAEPNFVRTPLATPNDTYFTDMWSMHNTGQNINGYGGNADADIDAPEAWDVAQSLTFQNITVAVVDTGVKYDHNDLAANMWDGATCRDDTGGIIPGGCPHHGWDYSSIDNNPMDDGDTDGDSKGHGTHVAGIIGAVANNSTGVSGFSLQNRIKIMAVRFGFTTFSEIKAINFAHQNGAKVINASFGGNDYSQLEKNAIDAFTGLVITAAGNGGADHLTDNNDATPNYPCSYDSNNIICVTATDQRDALASFANVGQQSVDISAPGSNILNTYANSATSYAYMSGTSMAAPHGSGAAAMIFSAKPAYTVQTIKNILVFSGDRISSLVGRTKYEKRLNLQSILSVLNDTNPPSLSNGAPTTELSTTNEPVYLTVSTSENALCKHSILDVQYDSMSSLFSTTGGTSHATLVNGLTSNSEFTYYIRCRDLAGNDQAGSYSITFTTSTAFIPYTPPTPAEPITTTVYKSGSVLKIVGKNRSKSTLLKFNGEASAQMANGTLKILQGRKTFALKRHININAHGFWNTRYRSKKGGSLVKFVYYNTAGQEIKTDGPYYVLVRK